MLGGEGWGRSRKGLIRAKGEGTRGKDNWAESAGSRLCPRAEGLHRKLASLGLTPPQS